MLFNSAVFLFAFLPVTYAVFWLLRGKNPRYVWLAITGYVFYGYWNPAFCLLMAFSTLVSYLAGLGFLRWWDDKARRRWLLVLPIAVDLCLLGYFKYVDFGIRTANWFLSHAGGAQLPLMNIILPVGISFYTFHTITYIVDSYRGVIKPTSHRPLPGAAGRPGEHRRQEPPRLPEHRVVLLHHRPGREGTDRRHDRGGHRPRPRKGSGGALHDLHLALHAGLQLPALLRLQRLQ
jgi:hypothetical protein